MTTDHKKSREAKITISIYKKKGVDLLDWFIAPGAKPLDVNLIREAFEHILALVEGANPEGGEPEDEVS